MDKKTAQDLKDIANKLRIHSISATNVSNSGYVFMSISFKYKSGLSLTA